MMSELRIENGELKMNTENPIVSKSYAFAVKLVKSIRELKQSGYERELISQLLRSGTSVGANVVEAQDAQSRKDFISKMNIALKEAREMNYWLHILKDAENNPPDV